MDPVKYSDHYNSQNSSENRFSLLKSVPSMAVGLGSGALLAYFADPIDGRHRRALVRDQLIHFNKIAQRRGLSQAHHMRNLIVGLAARTRSRLSHKEVSDELLLARVTSKIGRVVSNPHALGITADADDGVVYLRGQIFEDEVSALIAIVKKINGVKVVDSQFESHPRHARVPGLQPEAKGVVA